MNTRTQGHVPAWIAMAAGLSAATAFAPSLAAGGCATPGYYNKMSLTPLDRSDSASLVEPQALGPADDTSPAESITGLWKVNIYDPTGQLVDVAFDVWHSDGTEILNDYTNPILGNVCLGVYRQVGPGKFSLTHPSWNFDQNGNLIGTVIIHETVTVGKGGNTFSGTASSDVYDINGNLIGKFAGATVKATRITAN